MFCLFIIKNICVQTFFLYFFVFSIFIVYCLRLNIEEKKTKQRDHNGSGGERGGGQGFSDRVQGGRGERGSQVTINL